MAETVTPLIRRLEPQDLPAYKALRDEALERHPESFVSDPATERMRSPESYLGRLGWSEAMGGTFLLGAWLGDELAGSIACERELMPKIRHRANIVGMYVRERHTRHGIGRQLLGAAIDLARQADGLEMLVLTVTASNERAVRMYERAGFRIYGLLPRAIRIETGTRVRYYDKAHMMLEL
ncbi:GNAT family N-acetyltransferase [Caldimonas thermodepolymerans]|jgi:ribosomal protein S18 acetylase RimI-like enzyme|uniref:GNAT family N-acetyltransferase n=1 Tax=Caldimonas thermodepolymerans TaxID=215580 RepID=A0A2S5T0A9_9BURK|nr:GNAT family N-acetyltransferase [Caldimonas thermodepolymerans]PPE68372.1 GNAT family N-acetyltransferase [Caldimonas thermodepolymerans]QPC30156.1 GNAT family N-acetyltransferase [Caldimonas thermodepolymerans]RDI00537.1 ribosomal protein S18 acetylase RimI-like enzyme [Caldimonas thermodepolymerans]TCP07184.1 ribosomal protein S18 acetylase RimI-like enzyme [Caldimonas thermodepolymerans]UZG42911.1 GNAT family N-acetyltransferase [Caldimonas thermodepolymerans]